MRYFLTLLVLAFGFAAGSALAATPEDKAAFKAAYGRYTAAVEARDTEAAVTAASEALELGLRIYPNDHPNVANLYLNKGYALLDADRKEDAIEPLIEALNRYEDIYGKDGAELIEPLRTLAETHNQLGSDLSGVLYWQKLRSLIKKAYGPESFQYAEASMGLGISSYRSYERRRFAAKYFRQAYDIYQSTYGKPAYKTGLAAFWRAKAEEALGSKGRAEKSYLEALNILEETTPAGNDLQLSTHAFLVALFQERGKEEEATFHCREIARKRPRAEVDGYTPLYKKIPVYPNAAQRRGAEGWVIVEFTVDNDGIVRDPFVVESEGSELFREVSLDAVLNFRYAPAVKDGELVSTPGVQNRIIFQMAK